MLLINGIEQDCLSATDRAVQFGDGCFTTARVRDGVVHLLEAHLARLHEGCELLMIPVPDIDTLRNEMRLAAQEQESAVVKVIISRGAGKRGYSIAGCDAPTRIVSRGAYPDFYSEWRERGVSLATSPVRLGRNPHLAGIKHLNRLEQVLIRTHLEQTSADEALVLDSEGWVTECCAANLFWRKGKAVFTPRLDQAGVDGLMRRHIIGLLNQSVWRLSEINAPASALEEADEVFICNALMPLVPVRSIDGHAYASRELYHYLISHCE
ncbi:aminodeoxychorismate lyase [Cronobacter sakazakii]|uniref:aminodeoxychorismate lyase n=1 Tax=Cronobacter sakazakii TaxID=28141 RepID=UPI000BE7E17B|nr:aminodeoxychorismate lyase [Cronobacter sakazakii]EKK3975328.1 aminodeoxychorismate lyase [Cronobacter sakazakii]EKY1981011.1 aminodeoxychorismate lyase [Cronobacter sakazakii]EKY1998541.1 aminodeoxychorismate lyase [Cronobacter sakazakii]ELQ6140176.1 aminodeoxychorismate lyase [Cronobacter sakazakii]ELY2590427.1 aminodeoxychorismate lyase [Cronobacter sakazakii]